MITLKTAAKPGFLILPVLRIIPDHFFLQRLEEALLVQFSQHFFVDKLLGFLAFGVGAAVRQVVDRDLHAGQFRVRRK